MGNLRIFHFLGTVTEGNLQPMEKLTKSIQM
jgi:hypothetical protein